MQQLISVGGSEGNTSCVMAGLIPHPRIWFCLLAHKGPLKPTISYNLLLLQPWNDILNLRAMILPRHYLEPNQWNGSIGPRLFQESTCFLCVYFLKQQVIPMSLLSCPTGNFLSIACRHTVVTAWMHRKGSPDGMLSSEGSSRRVNTEPP